MEQRELYAAARRALRPIPLKAFGEAGHVACALETAAGSIYTGVCIDLPCGLGFCAEQAAAAEMLKSGETKIRRILAVDREGRILPPCGRCREFLTQIDGENIDTLAAVEEDREMPLRALLPERWDEEKRGTAVE